MSVGLSAQDVLDTARRRIHRYSPSEAARAQASGAILVDLRCESDRDKEGAIPDTIPIALSVLPWRADPASESKDARIADRAATLILICNDGYSSSVAAATLVDMGFAEAADLDGGFRAWAAEGLPVATVQ